MAADVKLTLPGWLNLWWYNRPTAPASTEETMAMAIDLAGQNIFNGTGGPFGALIVDIDSREIVAPGINMVTSAGGSIWHAEMVALTVAQTRLRTFDLGSLEDRKFALYTSVEPCAMCFGAIPWSGVVQVFSGACDQDARAIGFDEGPKVNDWAAALEERGIAVTTNILQAESAAVLNEYADNGGAIYNGRANQ